VSDEEPIEIPIEDSLDLHPFRPEEIRDVAHEYLLEARKRGFREVRLIHGRGRGVQRANVQSLLGTLEFVESFHDDAHLGATVVVLLIDSA
jgi:DNA-nicking Smr family endonuclease